MIIENVQELLRHMRDIGVRFLEQDFRYDEILKFDRTVNGQEAAQYVDTWIYIPEGAYVELGADYNGDPERWFSEHFNFPFDSDEFDDYLFTIEQHRE